MTTLRLLLAAAITVFATVASAQTTTSTDVYDRKGNLTRTDPDGAVTTITRSRGPNGTDVYTSERTPAPRRLADIMRDSMPDTARALRRVERDGSWNGYEGSPRDAAWMEACRPTFTTDRYGMTRYVYAKPGCESGEAR